MNQVVVGGLLGGVEGLWLLAPAGGPRLPLLHCGATKNILFPIFEANVRQNTATLAGGAAAL